MATLTVKVLMLAFGKPGQVREVSIPDEDYPTLHHLLEAVFYYGQNDFQPQHCPSVSAGDVIQNVLGGPDFFMVAGTGFLSMDAAAVREYAAIPQHDRTLARWDREEVARRVEEDAVARQREAFQTLAELADFCL